MYIYPNVDIVHWGYKDFAGNLDKFLKGEKRKQLNAQLVGADGQAVVEQKVVLQ